MWKPFSFSGGLNLSESNINGYGDNCTEQPPQRYTDPKSYLCSIIQSPGVGRRSIYDRNAGGLCCSVNTASGNSTLSDGSFAIIDGIYSTGMAMSVTEN